MIENFLSSVAFKYISIQQSIVEDGFSTIEFFNPALKMNGSILIKNLSASSIQSNSTLIKTTKCQNLLLSLVFVKFLNFRFGLLTFDTQFLLVNNTEIILQDFFPLNERIFKNQDTPFFSQLFVYNSYFIGSNKRSKAILGSVFIFFSLL